MRATRQAAGGMVDQFLCNLGNMEDLHTKVTEALGGEGGSHHTATNPSGSKLGGDDGRKRVVATDAEAHLNGCSARVLER